MKPEILQNILKTYAFFNPEIEYCQGMNFVAGFLYLVFRDEQLSFKALMRIADIFDMSHLYKKELPKLKLFFYQLDRLIAVRLPMLHRHFKDEQINSGIFASAWFITQFTNSLQIQEKYLKANGTENLSNGLISDNLLQLWDYFIASGWKSMFKMSLYLLKQNETQLLHLNFEEILTLIQEQPKIMLSGNCSELDEIEYNYYIKNETLLKQGRMELKRLDDEETKSTGADQSNSDKPDEEEGPAPFTRRESPITIYQRFKKEL